MLGLCTAHHNAASAARHIEPHRATVQSCSHSITSPTAATATARFSQQDAREWKWREEEIEQIQRDRLDLVERLVAERSSSDHANQQRRLDEVYARRRAEWEEAEKKGYSEGLRELRKLTRRRETVERTRPDRSAVAAYTDAGSEVYVGAAREGGASRDAAGERLQVNSR